MKPNLFVRIVAPVVAISALPLVIGIASAWSVHSQQKQASTALAGDVEGVRAGEKLAIGIRDVRTDLNQYLLTRDAAHLNDVTELRPQFDEWLAEAKAAAFTGPEKELAAQLRAGCQHFFDALDAALREPSVDERSRRIRELVDKTLSVEMLTPAQKYLDANEEEITDSNAKNQKMAKRVVLGLLLLGVCGPLSGLVAGFGIARGYSRSIIRLSLPIQDAAGKLNEIVGPITFSAQANLEEIEIVLHKMADQIGDVVQRLHESRREALRAEQLAAVGQMAAGIAHELRNPLMAMKILIQAAAERSPAALDGHDLAVLEEEITRLEHSTEAFLDFARPPQLERRTFDLRTLVGQIFDLLSGRAQRQGVRLNCDIARDRAVPVRADMGQVRQVLLNLLLNALDATPSGGSVRLEMELSGTGAGMRTADETTPSWLTLRVFDTGPGLPRELGATIFEPFIGTKPSGIGLGLSICKRIVESHGGEIEAANRPEGGAVFTVRLPWAAGAAPVPPQLAATR